MRNISGSTLMLSIQAIKEEIKKYRSLVKTETIDDPEEFELLILSYTRAMNELESLYQIEFEDSVNLPSFDELTKDLYE